MITKGYLTYNSFYKTSTPAWWWWIGIQASDYLCSGPWRISIDSSIFPWFIRSLKDNWYLIDYEKIEGVWWAVFAVKNKTISSPLYNMEHKNMEHK